MRISRLWCNKSDFDHNKENIRSWFIKREFPEKRTDSETSETEFNVREINGKNKSENEVPSVVTHHLVSNSLYSIIRKNIFFIWIKRPKRNLVHNPWCLFVAPISWVASNSSSRESLSFGKKGGFIHLPLQSLPSR